MEWKIKNGRNVDLKMESAIGSLYLVKSNKKNSKSFIMRNESLGLIFEGL